ncbi:hypothetical protein C2S51_013193 [Perilla frutescens var. frutescens]|nr:hypothetical protein C2S51_013193 [Perilla frutescens var. frutescens]
MAYAALVSLSQTTNLILSNDKYSLSDDEKQNITSIHDEYVNFLLSFLEDPRKKLSSRRAARIRDVANEAEDIIEIFMWKQIQMKGRINIVELSRAEFERQLGEVTEKIGLIAGEMMDEPAAGDSPSAISSSGTAPAGKNSDVIGLERDLKAIKERLCGDPSGQLQIIPIVGMGGIGKTTLALNVYDDQFIIDYFPVRAWVTVSQDYRTQNILSTLMDFLKEFDVERRHGKNTGTTGDIVYRILKGRRYLIVLDDMWSTEAWDDMRQIFPDDCNGSRIMLTTRLSDVATYADGYSPHHKMSFMNDDQSRNLLRQKVFGNSHHYPPELEEIGNEILRSCGGLPLAVVLVGGILSNLDQNRASWEEISTNVSTAVGGQLENILSLSYTNLPRCVRPFFLLMGGFPEDYEIHVSRLIKLWVGEGFMKPKNASKSLEEEGEEYLDDLIKRSLVFVTSKKSNGKIKSCRLHDMVRDSCIKKAEEEKFLLQVKNAGTSTSTSTNGEDVFRENINIKERRISITYSNHHLNNIWCPTIHTILSFLREQHSFSLESVDNFRLLRVMDVVNDEYRPLPKVFAELFLLRYLALGNCVEIPPTISNLENLQTLIIRPRFPSWDYLPVAPSSLPLEIWKMTQLRHLDFFYLYELPDIPTDGPTLLPLENLQTLSTVANLVCSESILKMIPNLKKLGLVCLQKKDYQLHNVALLHKLEKLKLTLFQNSFWRGQSPAFPNTLRKLTLVGGQLLWREIGIVGSLPNLQVLKLRVLACIGDTWETSDEEFPELEYLMIEGSYLQHWITECSPFPKLKSLVLHHCPNLSEIPQSIGEISTLEVIEVDNVNQSLMESAKQIQEDQRDNYGYDDSLQVRCVHSWKHDRLGALVDLRL